MDDLEPRMLPAGSDDYVADEADVAEWQRLASAWTAEPLPVMTVADVGAMIDEVERYAKGPSKGPWQPFPRDSLDATVDWVCTTMRVALAARAKGASNHWADWMPTPRDAGSSRPEPIKAKPRIEADTSGVSPGQHPDEVAPLHGDPAWKATAVGGVMTGEPPPFVKTDGITSDTPGWFARRRWRYYQERVVSGILRELNESKGT